MLANVYLCMFIHTKEIESDGNKFIFENFYSNHFQDFRKKYLFCKNINNAPKVLPYNIEMYGKQKNNFREHEWKQTGKLGAKSLQAM